MFSANEGIAISRGRGEEVQGHAYKFRNGQWIPFFSFDYSDYPMITSSDSGKTIWTITHRTHTDAYRPVLNSFSGDERTEISLPAIMWDEVDHVMHKGIFCCNDGTAWMVGQQGHILFYDGKKWREVRSPLLRREGENVFAGDLNDVAMTSRNSGWAVGRSGAILRCENGKWKMSQSPTSNTLQKLSMVNDSSGWAVGDKGTILKLQNGVWEKIGFNLREQLSSVFAYDQHNVWIVGNNSTMVYFDGEKWTQDFSIKNYDDNFSDISVVKDSTGNFCLWVIGGAGIYTTSQSLRFSFTDITGEKGLRRTGQAGFFFNRSSEDFPDLFIVNEDGANLLFQNGGNHFADVSASTNLLDVPNDVNVVAIGDINNDGENDILQIADSKDYKMFLGTQLGGFRDASERLSFPFTDVNRIANNSVKLVDFDNDGNLDLYFSNNEADDVLCKNDGAGNFTNVFPATGIEKSATRSSYGATFSDFNNDGLIDIVIPYYISDNNKFFDLYLNKGNFKFVSSPDPNFFSTVDLSPTVCIARDFNNDGNSDLFVHCQKVPSRLLLNDGRAHFTDVTEKVGLHQIVNHPEPMNGTAAAADVNNDGWVDIFDGSKLYLNDHGKRFIEITERIGIQFVGTPTFADIDNDGDEDLFIGSTRNSLGKGDRAALFRNNLNSRNFIKVRLHGDKSNRSAIGAKVILENSFGEKEIREVGLGSSPMVLQDLHEVHFGVSPDMEYKVNVMFPSGVRREITAVKAGTILSVNESDEIQRMFILASKSMGRTLLLLDWKYEVPKFLFFIFIAVALFFTGKNINAGKFVTQWYFGAGLLAFYVLMVHVSINEKQIVSSLITLFTTAAAGIGSISMAKAVIQKREAKYISHYKILELLGTGGMGKVFKAIDTNTKKIVALKILNPELLKNAENQKRLSAEGHLLASFNHPHVVKVFEVGENSEQGFIAMEFLCGGTLREYLEKHHPIPVDEIKNIILQICDGLSEIHRQGIIHRDLKAGNIMLDESGILHIMDFGLSKSPLETTMTSLGTVMGTLGYVAPEQITNMNIDQRVDIFSLGVIFYELLTGELPFRGENEIGLIHSIFNTIPAPPSSLRMEIPPAVDTIVARCLSKEIALRYATVHDLLTDLGNVIFH